MKKYIREMMDGLRKKQDKGYVPPIPKPSTKSPRIDLNPAPEPALPDDLNNQQLSKNAKERERQLDFQAQENEERETTE
jgi:hypothetical protein